MTRLSKKENERLYMDAFLELMEYNNVSVEQNEPPKPDFTLKIGRLIVGVEMTEYSTDSNTASGHPRRLIEQEWARLRRFVMEAVNKCSALQGIYGVFSFQELKLPSRSDTESFVAQVIACAGSNTPQDSSTVCVHDFEEYPLLKSLLIEIKLRRVQYSRSWEWNHNTEWISIEESAFVNRICRKVQNSYDLDGLDQFWLLIVSGSSLSQAMGVNLQYTLPQIIEANEVLRKSHFCRAFVFQYMFDVAYEWPGWHKLGEENFRKRRV